MIKVELIKILENYNDYTEIHLINSCQDIDTGYIMYSEYSYCGTVKRTRNNLFYVVKRGCMSNYNER